MFDMGVTVTNQVKLDNQHPDPYRAHRYNNSSSLRSIKEGFGNVCGTMKRMGHSICGRINCAIDFISKHDPKSFNSKDGWREQLDIYPTTAIKDNISKNLEALVSDSNNFLVNSDSTLYSHNAAGEMISQSDAKHEYNKGSKILPNTKCTYWTNQLQDAGEYRVQNDVKLKEEHYCNETCQPPNKYSAEQVPCKPADAYVQEINNQKRISPPCCLQTEAKNNINQKPKEGVYQGNDLFDCRNVRSDNKNKQELKPAPNPRYFEKIKKLGEGAYSNVYLLVDKATKKKYISKHLNPDLIWNLHNDPESKSLIPYEIHMLRELKKRNYKYSVECFGIYKYKSEYVLLMEYMGSNWVDMYTYISDLGPNNVREIKYVFLQILDAVSYLHKIGITHNDIKDENILIDYRTLQIKIIDFGSALVIKKTSLNKFYGTRRFASPQVITHSPYNQVSQELWSLGALLFVFSYKMNPFNYEIDILRNDIYYQIQRADYENSKKNNGFYITDNIKNTMAGLMQKNEKHRISVEQAKRLMSME